MMPKSKQPELFTFKAVANSFNTDLTEVQRMHCLGFLPGSEYNGQQFISQSQLTKSLPKLSNLPKGIKRNGDWYLSLARAKFEFTNSVRRGLDSSQKLTSNEVAARLGHKKQMILTTKLLFTDDIRDEVTKPASGNSSRIRFIGRRSSEEQFWEPKTIADGYVAFELMRFVGERTGNRSSRLFESRVEYERIITAAVRHFMDDSFAFFDSGVNKHQFSLAHVLAFRRSDVEAISKQIF